MASKHLSDPGPVKKKSKGKKKPAAAKKASAAAGASKRSKRSGSKAKGAVASARSKLAAWGSSPRGKLAMGTVVQTGEILIAGGAAAALQGYRTKAGLKTKVMDTIDWRVVTGFSLGAIGLYFNESRASSHLLNAGTGVLASFVLDKAAEWGAARATPAASVPVSGVVVGQVDEVGKFPYRRTKEERLQGRMQRVEDRQGRVRGKMADNNRRERPEQGQQGGGRRKVFVLPETITDPQGNPLMPAGRYAKVGVLANY